MNRILYVSFDNLAAAKGAATHITKFIEALQAYHSLTVISISNESTDQEIFSQQTQFLSFGLPAGHFLDRIKIFQEKLATHLATHHYHIIHFRSIWEGIIVAQYALRNRCKLIYEVNGFPSIELKYHYPLVAENSALQTKLQQQELMLLFKADYIITPALVTKAYIQSLGIVSTKIEVIPNGVEPTLFRTKNFDNHSLADPTIKLIYTGTLAPWQGISTLLKAVASLTPLRLVQLKLIGASRKSWLKSYQKLIREYDIADQVEIIPPCSQTELAIKLAEADIAVAPLSSVDRNLQQGCCPIKILEYAAVGLGIIATRLPVVTDLFKEDEHLLLYEPDNSEDLARQILKLADDLALQKRLGQAAQQLVNTQYTWQHAQTHLLSLYSQLLLT